jgi:predicted nucleic acid-binding protein
MKPQVLIDTSIWVEYFRGKDHEVVEVVKGLIRTGRATLCGIVLSELLAGVRTKRSQDTLKETLEALEYAEVSRGIWILAGEMSSSLRRHGVSIPLTDLVVAALAVENGSELFTGDAHFDRIPELRRFEPVKA